MGRAFGTTRPTDDKQSNFFRLTTRIYYLLSRSFSTPNSDFRQPLEFSRNGIRTRPPIRSAKDRASSVSRGSSAVTTSSRFEFKKWSMLAHV